VSSIDKGRHSELVSESPNSEISIIN